MKGIHRLKLVMGVDISRRDMRRVGRDEFVWRISRRRKAERRTRLRRLAGVIWMDAIAGRRGGKKSQGVSNQCIIVDEF
jgi:hypothetical protein